MESWYFSRQDLADHYLKIFDIGISSNIAIFAPRRRGKTLFLLKDIAPLAQEKNYIPIYTSFWLNPNAPHETLLDSLEEALSHISKRNGLSKILHTKIKKAAIKNELLGAFEMEFADSPVSANSKNLAQVDKLIKALIQKAGKKTLLLLIDEVQHLATDEKFQSLTFNIRTILDKHQGKVKAIFTGSSRHYMHLLFNQNKAAFYHFVESVDFPDLDKQFCTFLSEKLHQDYHIALSSEQLWKAFKRLDLSPYWMLKALTALITDQVSLSKALEKTHDLLIAAEGLEEISQQLKPIDKIVFLIIAKKQSPFTKKAMQVVTDKTNLQGNSSNIQKSITRLKKMNIVSQSERGVYRVEKPGLKEYLS